MRKALAPSLLLSAAYVYIYIYKLHMDINVHDWIYNKGLIHTPDF